MALRLVLFDFDDTLFDHHGTVRRVYEILSKKYVALTRHTIDEIVAFHHRALEELHPKILAGEISPPEGRILRHKLLFEACGSHLNDDEARVFAQESRHTYIAEAKLNIGALELLRHLAGQVKVGIVTNNLRQEQEDRIRSLGIETLIDFLVAFEDVQVMKPHPLMIETALSIAGVSVGESVLIGNSWESDVEAALAVGMKCIWLTEEADRGQDGVWVVDRLGRAVPILDRLVVGE